MQFPIHLAGQRLLEFECFWEFPPVAEHVPVMLLFLESEYKKSVYVNLDSNTVCEKSTKYGLAPPPLSKKLTYGTNRLSDSQEYFKYSLKTVTVILQSLSSAAVTRAFALTVASFKTEESALTQISCNTRNNLSYDTQVGVIMYMLF